MKHIIIIGLVITMLVTTSCAHNARREIEETQNQKRFLTELGYEDVETIPGLVEAFEDENPEARNVAATLIYSLCQYYKGYENLFIALIEKYGEEEVFPTVIDWLDDEARELRSLAAHVIHARAPLAIEAVPTLVKILGDSRSDPIIVSESAFALRDMGPAAKDAVPGLIELLKSEDWELQWNAVRAYGDFGEDGEEAIPILVGMVQGNNVNLADDATSALGRIGPASAPVLISILSEGIEDNRVALAVINALGSIGPDSAGAVPLLIDAMLIYDAAEENDIRDAAANTIVRIGPEAAPAVAEALSKYDPLDALPDEIHQEFIRHCLAILGDIGADAENVVPLVQEYMHSGYPDIRKFAAYSLGLFGPDAAIAVDYLIASLDDEFPEVRYNAAKALGLIGPAASDALPKLELAKSSDPNGTVRKAAEEAIAAITDKFPNQ